MNEMSNKLRHFFNAKNKSISESFKCEKGFNESNNWIEFAFLTFDSNLLINRPNVDSNEGKAPNVKNAFKSLNTLSTYHLIEKSLKPKVGKKYLSEKQLKFEENDNQMFYSKGQHFNGWKTVEALNNTNNNTSNDSKLIEQKSVNFNKTVHIMDDIIYSSADYKKNVLKESVGLENYDISTIQNCKYKPKTPNLINYRKSNNEVDMSSLSSTIDSNQICYQTSHTKNNSLLNECLVRAFIDSEAEVICDTSASFSDDEENTQKEQFSQSFIDDSLIDSQRPVGQLIGGIDSRSAQDMKSVYLQSVKDRLVGDVVKFKLQYEVDPGIDVFSQEPDESETGDYELDSFCVPNDCIVYEKSPEPESRTQSKFAYSSPSPQMKLRQRKRFKRIIFDP